MWKMKQKVDMIDVASEEGESDVQMMMDLSRVRIKGKSGIRRSVHHCFTGIIVSESIQILRFDRTLCFFTISLHSY